MFGNTILISSLMRPPPTTFVTVNQKSLSKTNTTLSTQVLLSTYDNGVQPAAVRLHVSFIQKSAAVSKSFKRKKYSRACLK